MSEILKQWNEEEDYFSRRYASSRHRCHETMQPLRWWKRKAWNSSKGKTLSSNSAVAVLSSDINLQWFRCQCINFMNSLLSLMNFLSVPSHRISKLNWNSNNCIDVTQQQHASSVCELKFHSHPTWTFCVSLWDLFSTFYMLFLGWDFEQAVPPGDGCIVRFVEGKSDKYSRPEYQITSTSTTHTHTHDTRHIEIHSYPIFQHPISSSPAAHSTCCLKKKCKIHLQHDAQS